VKLIFYDFTDERDLSHLGSPSRFINALDGVDAPASMRSWCIKRGGTSAEGGRKKHASSTCFLQAAYRASRYSYFTLALRTCFSILCSFIYPFPRCCTKHQRLSVLLCMHERKRINLRCFVYIISNYRTNKGRKKTEIARQTEINLFRRYRRVLAFTDPRIVGCSPVLHPWQVSVVVFFIDVMHPWKEKLASFSSGVRTSRANPRILTRRFGNAGIENSFRSQDSKYFRIL